MTDHNSPEAIEARKNQEDPIIMYLVVRESLGMSIGKTAAQCAHASQMLMLTFNEMEAKDICGWASDLDIDKISLFRNWLKSSFRKVVLKADDKEWIKLKEAMEEHDVIVVDAGLTEIAANSETVIGLWPMHKSKVGKLVKRLQVLK